METSVRQIREAVYILTAQIIEDQRAGGSGPAVQCKYQVTAGGREAYVGARICRNSAVIGMEHNLISGAEIRDGGVAEVVGIWLA